MIKHDTRSIKPQKMQYLEGNIQDPSLTIKRNFLCDIFGLNAFFLVRYKHVTVGLLFPAVLVNPCSDLCI